MHLYRLHRNIVGLLILILLNCGCGQLYNIKVNSISSIQAITDNTFIILPGNKDTSFDDLQFKEYAEYVKRALIYAGYLPANNYDDANMVVFLGYGIGEPQFGSFKYEVPIYGQTGVSSSHTSGSINTYGNTATYSGTTTYTPSYGVIGYKTEEVNYSTFTRYVLMDCYKIKLRNNNDKDLHLWRTEIQSTGSSGDLRRVFPVMVGGSLQYIGANTKKRINITITENNNSVLIVKGIQK